MPELEQAVLPQQTEIQPAPHMPGPGHTACALAASPQHLEPAQLLAAAMPPTTAPATQAGGSTWAPVLAQLAGQSAGTHTQDQAAVADGWVSLGCHKAAAFLTRENSKSTSYLCHLAKPLANSPQQRDMLSYRITLRGPDYKLLPVCRFS